MREMDQNEVRWDGQNSYIQSCANVMTHLFRRFNPASQEEVDMLRKRNEILEQEIDRLNEQVRKIDDKRIEGSEEITHLQSVVDDYAKQTLDHVDVIANLTETINRLAGINKRDAEDDLAY